MNRIQLIVSLLAVVFLAGSCQSENRKKNDQADEVRDKANELLDATGDYVVQELAEFDKRLENYQKKTRERLSRVNEWVDEQSDEARKAYLEQVSRLEKQQQELEKKARAYKRAGEDKKRELRKEIEDLNDAIRKSYETFEKEMGDL